jgi:predicted AlkP superfamily pyrophosphatase or phosphodiesterase
MRFWNVRRQTAVGVMLLAGCTNPAPNATPAPEAAPAAKPTLLVFITVDQFRPDYLDRFRSQLHGGLARLVRSGAYFTDAHQDYAVTETAPGHASTMSGRFPRSTGITRNLAGVGDPKSPLIGSKDGGASPFRFRGTTVTDWLTDADSRTRALSVSAKDRGAILPIGRSKQQVFWYANNGIFTTSTWYADSLPTWLTRFNGRSLARNHAGGEWRPLLGPGEYSEPDSVAAEIDGKEIAFPHRFPADSARTALLLRFTPMVDELTAAVALEGLRQLDLGKGPTTDVLAVSFSATDYVGHFFGPESKEQHDQILRLDRVLGGFLDTLFTLRDPSRVVIAMTADHGGGTIPELHGKRRIDLDSLVARIRGTVKAAGGDGAAVEFESGGFFVDPAKLGSTLSADQLGAAFIEAVRRVPGVLRVDRFTDLRARDTTKDVVARRWLQMFSDDLAPFAVATPEPGSIFKVVSTYPFPIVATHGTPHDYDSHVPIIFVGRQFKRGRYPRFVRTVDIAPTLALVLGVKPSEALDGRPLREAVRR